jgi:hypothetical protein
VPKEALPALHHFPTGPLQEVKSRGGQISIPSIKISFKNSFDYRKHLYTGGYLGSKQVSPKLILDPILKSSFDLISIFSMPCQRFTYVRLSEPHLPQSYAVTFPKTLTTMALNQRSFWWFEAYSCKPASRGHPSSPLQLRGAQDSRNRNYYRHFLSPVIFR